MSRLMLTASAALLAMSVLPASSADLARPILKASPAALPISKWTGFYIGANVGGGWANRDVDYSPNDLNALVSAGQGLAPPPSASFRTSGALGGFQVGYNYQFAPAWLVGIEGDFQWSGVKGSGVSSGVHAVTIPFTLPVEESNKWFGTIRGRLGVLPASNILVFATGGFAYGRVEHNGAWINNSNGFFIFNNGPGTISTNCGPGTCWTGSSSGISSGWTFGGGLEYQFLPRWTLKAEYLYVSLAGRAITESATATLPGFPTPSSFNGNFSHTNFNVARVGLNYRL